MTDAELVTFLQWAAALLGLRWKGLRRFRGTIRKRLNHRLGELGLQALSDYRERVERAGAERERLEAMCRIPISRLYRDRAVFDRLAAEVLPERARAAEREGRTRVRVWSAGCASGEEPSTVAMIWHLEVAPAHPGLFLELVATDADLGMIERAERGVYGPGSVRELPPKLREAALREDGSRFVVEPAFRVGVTFRQEDFRRAMPEGPFDVILCRNSLLTYVDERLHRPLLAQMVAKLLPGGTLVVGAHETLPEGLAGLERRAPGLYSAQPRG